MALTPPPSSSDSPSEAHDFVLIREVLDGKTEVFDLLVRRHRQKLLDAATRILGQREEAEDITQQVFIEAFRHLAQFQGNSQFSTWLYSITLNRIKNLRRRRQRERLVPLTITRPDDDHEELMPIPDKLPTPDTVAEKKADQDLLHQAIQQLPPDFRTILVLHYFHHLPLEQIGQRVGRPLNTVKVYLHRARKVLLERMQELSESRTRSPE